MKEYLFVLGAGASQPYGYPTGQQLKWNIINDFSNSTGPTYDLLRSEFSAEVLKGFAASFKASKLDSIDAFLRMNTDYELIGKKAIAANILQAQSTSNLDPAGKDWFGYIYNRLIGTDESRLSDPRISFITYNYDHSIEVQLINAFKHSFNLNDTEAKKSFVKIKIHHVYGDIGDFSSPLNHVHKINEHFHFENNTRARAIEEAAKSIKVMYGQRDEVPEDVREMFFGKEIYFLGFGFDKLNIQRLGIDWKRFERVIVKASGFGLTNAEKASHIQSMGIHANKIVFGHQTHDCYHFLREHFV